MSLENHFLKIRTFILDRYKDNLAGLLVFGSANTGHFIDERSDIDTMIFLKEQNNLDLDEERTFLLDKLKSEHFANQYFYTLESIKKYINRRKSFSTYITIVGEGGSRVLYSTSEFEETKKQLRENPPTKEEIKEFLKQKDEFELEGYFRDRQGFDLTKALMAHIRRKLQIINYFKTGDLIFDYKVCLSNSRLDETEKLKSLYDTYVHAKDLSKEEAEDYYGLARELTDKITKM